MNNWQTKKLSEILKLEYGKPLPKSHRKSKGLYPVYGANGIKAFSDKFYVDKPSIVIGRKGSAGELNLTKKKFWPLDVTYFVTFDEKKYDLKFLYSLLETLELPRLAKGVKPGINRNEVYSIEVKISQLDEQKRIVKKLDEVFEKVEKAKESAEKNLQNSKELFESYVNNIFTKPNRDWKKYKLYELSKNKNAVVSGPFGSNLKVSDYRGSGVPIFRLQNIGKGYFIDKDIKFISKEKAEELKYHSFVSGDLILAKLGIPIGKTCIVPERFKAGIIVADVVRIRPDRNVVDYNFLKYFLNTDISVGQLTGNISGSTRPRVNLSDVRNINLRIPKLEEQKNIVGKLNMLSIETRKLEKIYEQKLEGLDELKKSVLKKAFSGELITEASVQTIQVAIPSPYFRNQVHAAIIDKVAIDGGSTTEVALAKYDHLLQEVWGLSLGYQFKTHQFGPFDAQIKRLVTSGLGQNKWFAKKEGMVVSGPNISSLLSRQSNLYRSAQSKMQELARLGITKLNAEKVELLSTVCHSIKETSSVTLDNIRDFMSQWKTDNNSRTKAEKFTEEQTQKCLEFIIKNDLHKKLLQTT